VPPAEASLAGSSADYGAAVVMTADLISQSFDGPADWAETGMPV
jgi:hypothetical protein